MTHSFDASFVGILGQFKYTDRSLFGVHMTPTQANSHKQANSYKNMMEVLVDEEIDRQTHDFPIELAKQLNRIELATYALNRLPTLYASSREGVEFQYERGKNEMDKTIQATVQQALETVKEAPHRNSTPFL